MLKKIIEDAGVVWEYISWSSCFAFIYVLFSPNNRSIAAYLTAMVVAIPMGTLAGMIAGEQHFSEGATYAIVSVTALLSQDFVKFVLAALGFIQDHKATIFDAIYKWAMSRIKKDTEKNNS